MGTRERTRSDAKAAKPNTSGVENKTPDRRASLRHAQGLDGSDAFPHQDLATCEHRDEFACTRLQYKTSNAYLRSRPAHEGNEGLIRPSCHPQKVIPDPPASMCPQDPHHTASTMGGFHTPSGRGCVKTPTRQIYCGKRGKKLSCSSILSRFVDQNSPELKSEKLISCFHTASAGWRHSFVGCSSGLGGLNILVSVRMTVCQSIHVLNRIGRVVAATLDILRGSRRR
jgi:hypothetical protein